jgi:tetratricopeptide (TPR) repeat protein
VTNDGATARPQPAAAEAAFVEPMADAVGFWQTRVDGDPHDFVSRTQLASALLTRARATHNIPDAITAGDEIDQVLTVVPDDISALLVKSNAVTFVHNFPVGLRYAEKVLAKDPTHKVAIAMVGDAYFELGDLDRAGELYDRLAQRVGVSPEVSARRARLAHARGDDTASLAFAEQAIREAVDQQLAPTDSTYYTTLLAELQRGFGRYDDAAASFQRVLDVRAEDGPAIEGLAKVEAARGDLDASERLWSRSGRLIGAPDFHVLSALGDIAHARGDDARARDLWNQALVAVTSLPPVQAVGFQRDVSRFRASHGLDVAASLRLAEADVKLRQDGFAHDTLAWAQLANGKVPEARANSDAALATGVRDAGVYYHAAEIAAAQGDTARAREFVHRALDLSPGFDLYEAAGARALADRLG